MRRNRNGLYYRFTPGRLAFVYTCALGSVLAVYTGHGAALRYGIAISIFVSAGLAYLAFRAMIPSRYEAPLMQELQRSKIPGYMLLACFMGALALAGYAPPANNVLYAAAYGIFGYTVASINAYNLIVFIAWQTNTLDSWVARTPYWLHPFRSRIPDDETKDPSGSSRSSKPR